jgi:hypothetical protein
LFKIIRITSFKFIHKHSDYKSNMILIDKIPSDWYNSDLI